MIETNPISFEDFVKNQYGKELYQWQKNAAIAVLTIVGQNSEQGTGKTFLMDALKAYVNAYGNNQYYPYA